MSNYSCQNDRTPEENVALPLYAIANELSNLGLKDAGDRRGAIELLSEEVRSVHGSLEAIAKALLN